MATEKPPSSVCSGDSNSSSNDSNNKNNTTSTSGNSTTSPRETTTTLLLREKRRHRIERIVAGMSCFAFLVLIFFVIKTVDSQSSEFKLNQLQLENTNSIFGGDVITDIQSITKDGSDDRLFVATRGGMIHVVNLNKGSCTSSTMTPSIRTTPFLDISSKVRGSGEMGLLGLSFHPNYSDADNGYFFVHYTNRDSNGVFARYRRSQAGTADDGNEEIADPNSETILKIVEQPATNHNGGGLQFSPIDGMLYIGLGDGGFRYDMAGDMGYGQNLNTYLGKILRVNVSDFTLNTWSIPTTSSTSPSPGNPFVETPNALDEIWSYGLRNPWRLTFDRNSGDMYIADVGQNAYEEVNYQPATSMGGENYGWCICEANEIISASTYSHCAPPSNIDFQGCSSSTPSSSPQNNNVVGPIIEYPHRRGGSITGGYVYRGVLYPNFDGIYFYADFVQNFVLGAKRQEQEGGSNMDENVWKGDAFITSDVMSATATTFGEDSCGEIYVGTSAGSIYQITDPNGVSVGVEVPTTNGNDSGDDLPSSTSNGNDGGPTTPISDATRLVLLLLLPSILGMFY